MRQHLWNMVEKIPFRYIKWDIGGADVFTSNLKYVYSLMHGFSFFVAYRCLILRCYAIYYTYKFPKYGTF